MGRKATEATIRKRLVKFLKQNITRKDIDSIKNNRDIHQCTSLYRVDFTREKMYKTACLARLVLTKDDYFIPDMVRMRCKKHCGQLGNELLELETIVKDRIKQENT